MAKSEVAVVVKDVWKSFNGVTVLAGVNITADWGEVVGVVGPNGCGKTTLLRIIAGLLKPDRGLVRVRGRVGMVFQETLLLPWKKIRDNIALGLRYRGLRGPKLWETVTRVAKLLGVEEFLDHYPLEVSGGIARRTAIARILALNPQILLLDEPFTGLDMESRRSLGETIRRLASEGRCIIVVDHHVESLAPIADRVYVLSPPPARVKVSVNLAGYSPEERVSRVYQALATAWHG